MPRFTAFWKCIAFVICVFIMIITGSRYTDNINFRPCSETHEVRSSLKTKDGKSNLQRLSTDPYDSSSNIEHILENTRAKIEFDLRHYNFNYSGVQKLDDLLMECGGSPVRSIIVSTWRSGSSFLGEVLNAMPGSFYNFEPLSRFLSKQIRGPPHAEKAMSELNSILRCDYSGMDDYFDFGKKTKMVQLVPNTRLRNVCVNNEELCLDANFTAKFCKLFPFQSMKVVRLRLHLAKDLLENKELNAKMVLLVRDPRGVMQSRQLVDFCELDADCWKPELLCTDMITDYVAAGRLLQIYPDRLMVLRFEELAFKPSETAVQLLKFLRFDSAMPSIQKFLETHTSQSKRTLPFSTYRVSRDVPFKWKNALDFDYVKDLQEVCSEAMELWGYKQAHNASHMVSKDFYPLAPYTLMETV